MKTAKKLLVLLLTVLLVNTTMISSFALVTPAVTDANKGEVVTVDFAYNNIAGIRGTFTVTGDDIVEKMELETSGAFEGNYNSNKSIIAYFASAPANFVCTLKFTISDQAALGDEIKVKFEYESTVDGRLPATPSYSYDYATIKIVLNLDELNAQISIAEGYNEDEYTTETWSVLKTALEAAVAARNATTQAAVDAATKALKDAIAGLVKKTPATVDYTELNTLIESAKNYKEDDYTAETWDVFEDALEAAIAAKNATTQAAVDAAVKGLKDAIAGLVKKPGVTIDYTELNKQIEIAQKLKKDDYTAESWAALTKALDDAINARKLQAQPAVDAATKALKDAIAGLVKKSAATSSTTVDYTELDKQIAIAQALSKKDYTTATWKVLATALENAIKAKNATTQAEVDAAVKALKNAIAGLVKKAGVVIDYTELNKQIEIAQGLVEDDYTAESWAALTKALEDAINARKLQAQPAVDAATEALKDAIAALQRKSDASGVDYSKLKEQIDRANKLDKDEYTEESWNKVQKALDKGNKLMNVGSQAEVDDATAELKAAIDSLELKPTKRCIGIIILIILIILGLVILLILLAKKKKKN